MMRALCFACVLGVIAPLPCPAETPVPPERPVDTKPAGETPPPPYQPKLERLAELIGTLSFMRDLCGVGDGALWHAKMIDLLAAEGTTADRRDRLAGAFNKGLEGYHISYRAALRPRNW